MEVIALNRSRKDPRPRKQDYLPDISDTVSTTECTGLMPSLPADEAEFSSYQELSSMAIPKLPPDPKGTSD